MLVSLAALSRSSLSYFALVPFVVGFGRWRGRWMAAYLAPVLLLQGGWSLKNAAVHGGFSYETSSWSGYNLAIGLADDRQLPLLCADIAASPTGTYPDWFLSMNRVCPPPVFVMGDYGMPAYVVAQDAAARARLGGIDLGLNSLAVRMKSVQYKRAFTRYVLHHPASFARRFADGYHVLWQRIGDYGAIFVDPLFVVPADRGLFDLFSRGFGEHQRAMLSRADMAFVPTRPVSRKAASAQSAWRRWMPHRLQFCTVFFRSSPWRIYGAACVAGHRYSGAKSGCWPQSASTACWCSQLEIWAKTCGFAWRSSRP